MSHAQGKMKGNSAGMFFCPACNRIATVPTPKPLNQIRGNPILYQLVELDESRVIFFSYNM